jgi:hypothetical protein
MQHRHSRECLWLKEENTKLLFIWQTGGYPLELFYNAFIFHHSAGILLNFPSAPSEARRENTS